MMKIFADRKKILFVVVRSVLDLNDCVYAIGHWYMKDFDVSTGDLSA